MNLSTVFRIFAAVLAINGLMTLFATETFLGMAGMTVNDDITTLGQLVGVTFLIIAMIAYKTIKLAGESLAAFGRVYFVAELMWTGIIGYHIAVRAAEGATAYGNLGISAIMAILFFVYSRK